MSSTLEKQPNEDRLYDMEFSKLLGTGEAISSVNSVSQLIYDKATKSYIATTDLSLGAPSFSGSLAQVRISGGVDKKYYKITFLAGTDQSNILEGDGILAVVDK